MSKEKRDLYIRAQLFDTGRDDKTPHIHLSVWAIDERGYHSVTDQFIWDDTAALTGAPDRHYHCLEAELRLDLHDASFYYVPPSYNLDFSSRSDMGEWQRFDRMSKTLKRLQKEREEAERMQNGSSSYLAPLEFVEWFAKSVGAKGFIELGGGDERAIKALSIGFARIDNWITSILADKAAA